MNEHARQLKQLLGAVRDRTRSDGTQLPCPILPADIAAIEAAIAALTCEATQDGS